MEDLIVPFLPDMQIDMRGDEFPKLSNRRVSRGALPVADKLLRVFQEGPRNVEFL